MAPLRAAIRCTPAGACRGGWAVDRPSARPVSVLRARSRAAFFHAKNAGLHISSTSARGHIHLDAPANKSEKLFSGATPPPFNVSPARGSSRLKATLSTPPPTTEVQPGLQRSKRLEEVVKLRRVYRAALVARYLQDIPSPLWKVEETSPQQADSLDEEDRKRAEEENMQRAVRAISTMYFTEEELKIALRLLEPGYGDFLEGEDAQAAESELENTVQSFCTALIERAEAEAARLPPEGRAKLAAERDGDWNDEEVSATVESEAGGTTTERRSVVQAVVKGERRLEKAVKRFAPIVKAKVENPGWLLDAASTVKTYGSGLWERLNGKGQNKSVNLAELGFPAPVNTRHTVEKEILVLSSEIESLEKKVNEASKQREAKVRSAGLQTKARLAIDLMTMDREVINLSQTLGIRTLQLEMLYIFQTLEQEALEVVENVGELLDSLTSNDELALLAAEYSLLNEQLSYVALEASDAACLLNQDGAQQLEALSREIPDLRSRLDIGDGLVFGGGGFSIRRIQITAMESAAKIKEGVTFLVTGFRVLFADVNNALRIFLRAVKGGTLKPREVQALRRSVLDVLTFIPFLIILIIPLSPIGHVLVFGFIQRYFPSLYPSQFTARRQELMKRYEELKQQLLSAQSAAELEDDERELKRATEAVEALTAPRSRLYAVDSMDESSPAAAELRKLRKQVRAAKDDHLGLAD